MEAKKKGVGTAGQAHGIRDVQIALDLLLQGRDIMSKNIISAEKDFFYSGVKKVFFPLVFTDSCKKRDRHVLPFS